MVEPENANYQVKCRDAGENRDKPSHEDNKFVHISSRLFFLESQRYSQNNLNSLWPILSSSLKIAVQGNPQFISAVILVIRQTRTDAENPLFGIAYVVAVDLVIRKLLK